MKRAAYSKMTIRIPFRKIILIFIIILWTIWAFTYFSTSIKDIDIGGSSKTLFIPLPGVKVTSDANFDISLVESTFDNKREFSDKCTPCTFTFKNLKDNIPHVPQAKKIFINGKHLHTNEEHLDPFVFWAIMILIAVLVIAGGILAGLTIGLMSLDPTNLSILIKTGDPMQKYYASTIEPIRKQGHLLLVTLLLSNVIINESLPVLMHSIHLDGFEAILTSTALIVVFGEIIPQALCARYGLRIGALFAPALKILISLLWIISYPIASFLDWILGHSHGLVYKRAEFRELIALHGESHKGTLTNDEVSIVSSVLQLRDKTCLKIMTPIDDVFMLPSSAKLDQTTFDHVLESGHSRIPIYQENRENIIGVVLVKQLIVLDPIKESSLSDQKIRELPIVLSSTPLFELLRFFQTGGSHMAIVVEDRVHTEKPVFRDFKIVSDEINQQINQQDLEKGSGNKQFRFSQSIMKKSDEATFIGIVTLEDVLEELLGAEIIDETDVYANISNKVRVPRNGDENQVVLTYRAESLKSSDSSKITDGNNSVNAQQLPTAYLNNYSSQSTVFTEVVNQLGGNRGFNQADEISLLSEDGGQLIWSKTENAIP